MRVEDLIKSRREVFSVTPETTVLDAARYVRDKRVRAVGVRDNDGNLVGIVTQTDFSERVVAENKCPSWTRVSEIMTVNLSTVTPETPLEDCLQIMESRNIFHLPVVDEKREFHGLVSAKDLLKVIAADCKNRAETLESYVFPRWA